LYYIEKLKQFTELKNKGAIYFSEQTPPFISGVNTSNACHRVAIPLSGNHQMEIPTKNNLTLINPRLGDLVWMPMNSWNKPTWIKKVDTITLLFNSNYIQANNVIVNSAGEEKRNSGFRYKIKDNSHLQYYIHLLGSFHLPKESIHHLLIAFIINFVEVATTEYSGIVKSKGNGLYNSISIWLNEHAFKKINRKNAANEFRISEAHLSRLFQKYSDKSFNETLVDLRINYSKKLLQENRLTISEISNIIGFENGNYFARVFKKLNGISPLSWRNKV
jgi:AraC-like DNA-binding protein